MMSAHIRGGLLFCAILFFALIYKSKPQHEIEANLVSAHKFSRIIENRNPANFESLSGLNVTINDGEVAYLDESTNIDTLTIKKGGELHCEPENANDIVELRVKTIIIEGVFQCGTSSNPYKKKLIISLKHSNIDPVENHLYRGIIVDEPGKLILNGDPAPSGWVKLAQTAMPGDQFIIIESKQNTLFNSQLYSVSRNNMSPGPISKPWKVGDKIAIGPTGYNYLEAESFTIVGIDNKNPSKFFLDRPIQFVHWGEKERYPTNAMGDMEFDGRAEVANLTRSILIRADEADFTIDESNAPEAQRGGHIMVHHGGAAYINSVELYKMGQAGVMARYPFHWHWVGNAPGQFIKNSSVHHSYQRCIVVHRTNRTTVQNNVCYDFKGHGYFFEDGVEIQNVMTGNLAIMAKAPSPSKILLDSDNIATTEKQGRFPAVSSFWISNPDNTITFNVASGSVGTGFWMAFEEEIKNSSGTIIAKPSSTATRVFSYNTAHSAKVGITWDGGPNGAPTNNPNNPADKKIQSVHYQPPVIPTFIGLKAYKNFLTGIYMRGQTAIFKNTVLAENGWSAWMSNNQIFRNSVFIGKTANYNTNDERYFFQTTRRDRYRRSGVVIYDGPFEVHDSDFIDFSTYPETFTLFNGSTVNSTVVPFTATGASNRMINVVKGLTFSPDPVYRIHLEDPDVNVTERHFLANAGIRDLDGSLSNSEAGSIVVAKNSLGITKQSNCYEGGEDLYNFKVCPPEYTEGSMTFMRWDGSVSPWVTPFIVRRIDGATNYSRNEWSSVLGFANNVFAIPSSSQYSLELLPYFQYIEDRSYSAHAKMDANTEISNPQMPIVKIVAYGNNCRLGEDAIKVNSVNELKNQNRTAYYSSGDQFFVKIVPVDRWMMIEDSPLVTATSTATNKRYTIYCDNSVVKTYVKGKIEKVQRTNSTTTITGWTCNFAKSAAIKARLYAHNPISALGSSRKNNFHLIKEVYSNKVSDSKILMECGKVTSIGKRFEFTIPNAELRNFTNHKFYVMGISDTNGANVFIDGSGKYDVRPRFINGGVGTENQ